MKLQFLGGVQTVTGSKTLVTSGKHSVLVDCGLFQGLKGLRLKNREGLPIEPKRLEAVLLTHAHLDHSGYLPLLVKNGFRGKVYCSAPTRDLARLILEDSGRIQEEDADFANREGFSKHRPAEPLYSTQDVEAALDRFESVSHGKWIPLTGPFQFRLSPSSHILGSTFIELEAEGIRVVFSGDLGRSSPLLFDPPSLVKEADYLIIESTYGDRTHHESQNDSHSASGLIEQLAQIVTETIQRGGQLIIPSFAVGRAQDLLYLLSELKAQKRIPEVAIYLDSPMGVNATEIFANHSNWHRLNERDVDALMQVAHVIRSQKESISVMRDAIPSVIIAGSGMLTGGRVVHHLAARLPDPRNTVLLVGYQAAGTRGRLLHDGISELKMHGKYVPVRAQVKVITGLSAHADQSETLEWLKGFERPPSRVFINHGEPQASDALRVKIQDVLGWPCHIPLPLEEVELEKSRGLD